MSLPSYIISEKYLKNEKNILVKEGVVTLSTHSLPLLNTDFVYNFNQPLVERQLLKSVEKSNDSVYYNPFTKSVIEIQLESPYLDNILMNGNFILYSKDSIVVKKSAQLNDVILKSPKVILSDNFVGSIQIFATERIEVGKESILSYPSALCLYNNSEQKAEIIVNENTIIEGGIILFGSSFLFIDDNRIIIKDNSILIGDLYNTGKINLQGKIYGSVYCNSIFNGSPDDATDNCLYNSEINVYKRPDYFVSLPLFKEKKSAYGIIKKLF